MRYTNVTIRNPKIVNSRVENVTFQNVTCHVEQLSETTANVTVGGFTSGIRFVR